jgi:hypothetical protein
MLELRAQTGPVFLTYRASPTLDRIAAHAYAVPSAVRLCSPRRCAAHRLARGCRVPPRPCDCVRSNTLSVHRRWASPRGERRTSAAAAWRQGARGEWDTVLAVAFPDNQMQVLPYNRVVKDLGRIHPSRSSRSSGSSSRSTEDRRSRSAKARWRCSLTGNGTRSCSARRQTISIPRIVLT